MADNIIFYGPPGTGKTYLLQSMMNDYVDYDIADTHLKSSFITESEDWIIVSLVMLQHHGKMSPSEIQIKIDSLDLKTQINVAASLEKHDIAAPVLPGVQREKPRIYFKDNGCWYVDLVKVRQYRPDFYEKFLKNCPVTTRYKFVTFHQSYSYEDFIEGIRPEYIPSTNSIDYSPKDGVFKALCNEASLHTEKKYAIFIDEINRGNVSEIFGELISLLEIDKRAGEKGALSTTLPYSKSFFSVPSNVNVYGTMNTADRSIDQIDIALRRRFKFFPLLPSSNKLEIELNLQGIDPHNIDGVDLIKLFDTVNARIELLLDSQHLLGHALFFGITTAKDIVSVIKNSVIPLLEEYFFDDYQKIQLIFNDLDSNGDLKPTAIYKSEDIAVDDYFQFIGDYLIEDKKHFKVSDNVTVDSLKQIYL